MILGKVAAAWVISTLTVIITSTIFLGRGRMLNHTFSGPGIIRLTCEAVKVLIMTTMDYVTSQRRFKMNAVTNILSWILAPFVLLIMNWKRTILGVVGALVISVVIVIAGIVLSYDLTYFAGWMGCLVYSIFAERSKD